MATKPRKRARKKSKRDVDDNEIESRIFDIATVSPYVRILVYGENGKGKTRFAASFPKTLIIDINEEGTRSATQFEDTKVFHANDWSDLVAIYWYLQKGEHKFESVAIDTLTQMQVLAMRRTMGEKVQRDPDADPKQPRIQDYGKANAMMGDMILMFRNLPMHVCFLAQERLIGDPEEGEIEEHVPDLPNGSRKFATAAVGIIGRIYLVEKKVKRNGKKITKWINAMLIGPHEEYITKDRTGVLGRTLYQPTGTKVIDAWAQSPGEE